MSGEAGSPLYRLGVSWTRNEPPKSPAEVAQDRARHLADEYDLVYQQVEWMMMGCPASPGDQFTELGGVSRPRTADPAKSKAYFFPDVPLPRDYLDQILARDVGGVEVTVGPANEPNQTSEVDESAVLNMRFSGPVAITAARAAFERGLAEVIDRLGQVGKPWPSERPAQAAYLLWLVRGRQPPLGPEAAAEHWNGLRAQWYALETGESTKDASARGARPIKKPLDDNPEAYYAYMEWLREEKPGEEFDMDGKRVSLFIARLRPSFSEHARSGEDT